MFLSRHLTVFEVELGVDILVQYLSPYFGWYRLILFLLSSCESFVAGGGPCSVTLVRATACSMNSDSLQVKIMS